VFATLTGCNEVHHRADGLGELVAILEVASLIAPKLLVLELAQAVVTYSMSRHVALLLESGL
jgi:hypothetical protein